MLRQHQRSITKAQRELDRERERLERQEKVLISDIKKSAKANQMSAWIKQSTPVATTERVAQAEGGLSADDAALQARLDNLRRE
ncbi:hypothetical protein [Absidia glauca]|uniref:Uncharacterized protein n=1 Tax=Absidia glauca TaxID=4829 RepID=A0A168R8B9_ABSGL|nr:hypothetical protein [Absidia glauca]